MNFFDYVNISERNIELIDPLTPEKVLKAGRILKLNEKSRVIDFGCGYAEMLVLWAKEFGISGVGIEVREHACNRARNKVESNGFSDRIEIVCMKGADYEFKPEAFDVAACVGATFIWGGFRETIQSMRKAVKPGGRLLIGEAYWKKDDVPEEYCKQNEGTVSEYELMMMAREEGFDFEYLIRSSIDDWDNYEAANWLGALAWADEHPDHPQHKELIDMLHHEQDIYTRYTREYHGWAMYALKPSK